MAGYQPRNSGTNTQRPGNMASGQGSAAPKVEALFSSGLFKSDPAKSKALASVQTKEAITIPAGSYINLYEVENRKGDSSPIFKLQIRESKKKSV